MDEKFQRYWVEVVWNREFHWSPFGSPHGELCAAIKSARSIQDSGDGERVKKVQVVDEDGKVVWAYGKGQ